MKLVKQKRDACVPTSIFMLNDNKDFRKIKNMCKKRFGYSHSRGNGCFTKEDAMLTLLNQLGMQASSIDEGITYRTFCELSGYSRGLIMIQHKESSVGHCVAWNGYKAFDPILDNPISDAHVFKIYGDDIICSFYKVKTSLCIRLMNIIRKPFFELRYNCAKIIG